MNIRKYKNLLNAIYGVQHNAKLLRARLLALHLVRMNDKLNEFWCSDSPDVYSLCEMLKGVPEVELLLDLLPEYRKRVEELWIRDAQYDESIVDIDLEEYYIAFRMITDLDSYEGEKR